MLKVAQHKSLLQVQQEALKARGDDKESVADTELEELIRPRDTIEQCLKTFKNTVCSHSKLERYWIRGTSWTCSVPFCGVFYYVEN